MFLKKVCIFMAIVFACVDIFLLSMFIKSKNTINTLSEVMIKDTVTFFEKKGIDVPEEVLIKRIPENPIYTFYEDNNNLVETVAENIAEVLYGDSVKVSIIETPSGVSYNINSGEETVAYFKTLKNSYSFEYAVSHFDINEYRKNNKDVFENADYDSLNGEIKKITKSFLKNLSAKKNGKYKISDVKSNEDGSTVIIKASQLVYADYEIKDMTSNIVIENNKLVYAYGTYVFDSFKKKYMEKLSDGINALKSLDLTDMKSLVSEEIVYIERYSGTETHYLVPIWKIVYIDTQGNEKTQYIDAIKN